jgi:hypothetical protein
MTDLDTLITRVEALTGPDREVDAEIALAVGWVSMTDRQGDTWWHLPDGDWQRLPRLTGSLDAGKALLGQLLPGLGWSVGKPDGTDYGQCHIWNHANRTKPFVWSEAATEEIAFVAAILRAYRAKGDA